MRYFISIIMLNIFIALGGQAIVKKENSFKKESVFSRDSARQALTIDTSWGNFWKAFLNAINAKDKKTIASLTSKDFYDGGGGTVEEWLDADVFSNQQHFTSYQAVVKKRRKKISGKKAAHIKQPARIIPETFSLNIKMGNGCLAVLWETDIMNN